MPGSLFFTLSTITGPSRPAFSTIVYSGASSAFATILAPVFSSPSRAANSSSTFFCAWIYADPPPQIMPSDTAAFVAFMASSMRYLASFISVSVAAPTRITATPPPIFAIRSMSLSLSKSDVVSAICLFRLAMRASMSSLFPAPSTIVVFSFVTFTDFARPSISIVVSLSSRPRSSMIT